MDRSLVLIKQRKLYSYSYKNIFTLQACDVEAKHSPNCCMNSVSSCI